MTRKLVAGQTISTKDSNGIYIPMATTPPEPKKRRPREPASSDINLDDLMGKHLTLLYRETRSLLEESSTGSKLSKDSAQSMRDNMRLIMELKKKEKELLESLSDDDIRKLIEDKDE